MKKMLQVFVAAGLMFVMAGCGSSLSYKVEQGYSDTIKYSKETNNRVWVEMKGEEPSETGSKNILLEYEISREVESVNDDGSMLVKLTFDKVSLKMKNVSSKKEKENYYMSEKGNTKSTWKNEPAVAGKTVSAIVKPDSSVEFVDLDKLRSELKLSDEDNSTVSALIGEDDLKSVLEHAFLINCPKMNLSAKSWDSLEEIPDSMLNTKALRMIYTPDVVSGDKATFKTAIEPLYVLPEGMEEPPAAGDPFRQILKQNSDLQEPVVESEAVLDLATGLVTKDMLNVTYLMVVDGNKLFPEQQKKSNKNVDAGMMYIEIKIDENYEIVK